MPTWKSKGSEDLKKLGEIGGDVLDKNDAKKFIVSRREIVRFECPLSECDALVSCVMKEETYRSMHIEFCGYDDAHVPLVAVEVDFAVCE